MTYVQLIADCWSRGFDHAAYLDYAQRMKDHTKITPHTVSITAYKLICAGLDMDMEQNIGVDQPTDEQDDPVKIAWNNHILNPN